jgi:arsenate reductase
MLTIYHNPSCSKSRETLDIINEHGTAVKVVEYMNDIPTEKELRSMLKMLKLKPEQLLRKSEPLFLEKYEGKILSDDEWITVMTEHPELMERPVVVKGNRAILGRPPQNVLELL